MAKSRRVEVIEIPTEQLSYVPGPHPDGFAMLGRWSGAWRNAADAFTRSKAIATLAASVETARTTRDVGVTFRRMIEVPGGRLAAVLGAWWQQAEHDDGHLRLDVPRPVGAAWALNGAFRRTLISPWLPVELLLSPYNGRWTLLELMPRRSIHPSRLYFEAGHRSLDRFVAAIHIQDVLAERREDGASKHDIDGRDEEAHIVKLRLWRAARVDGLIRSRGPRSARCRSVISRRSPASSRRDGVQT